MRKNTVSIATACMNRQANLMLCLPSWLALPVEKIIIVDWSSDQPVGAMIRKKYTTDRIVVITVKGQHFWHLTKAFNLAISACKSSHVLKLDCDYFCAETLVVPDADKSLFTFLFADEGVLSEYFTGLLDSSTDIVVESIFPLLFKLLFS